MLNLIGSIERTDYEDEDPHADDDDLDNDNGDYKEECWLCPRLERVKNGEQGQVSPPN